MILYDLQNHGPAEQTGLSLTCAIGNFDGVHRGHRALLEKTVAIARATNTESAVFTFTHNTSSSPSLLTAAEKERQLASLSIRYMILCSFEEVRALSPKDFVFGVLIGQWNVAHAVCGFNFRFGFGGVGTGQTLCSLMEEAGRKGHIVPPVDYEGSPISSTRIRRALSSGEMEKASGMLGRPYEIRGTVTHGKHLGSSLGFPTANLTPDPSLLPPRSGVYASYCLIDGKKFSAVSNIGSRPTVDENGQVNCETNIIGFEGDLYGKELAVYPVSFLREETAFSSLDELAEAVEKDRRDALAFFHKYDGSKEKE